jgi:hypothetical protein
MKLSEEEMKNAIKYTLLVFSLVLMLLFATKVFARNITTIPATRFSAVNANTACNANVHLVDTASVTCQVFEVLVSRGDALRISATWDRTAGTALTVWADTSPDGSAPWSLEATPIVASPVTGALTMWPGSMVIDTAADGSLSWEFTTFTSVYVRFRFVWTGGGANDYLTVTTQHR